jgi:putative transposase
VNSLERARRWYGFYVVGYVVMPEHVHLLISEPERSNLAMALQMMKQQLVSRKASRTSAGDRFWQPRYYDFTSGVSANAWRNYAIFTIIR